MFRKAAVILVNYKDYAGEFLSACRASLAAQDYAGELKIFIVDNESSPESFRLLKKIAPEAEIIVNNKNDGFAKGNNDAMKRALEQGFNYVILFNMDTELAGDCVSKMAELAESQERIGAVQARLMLYQNNPSVGSGRGNKINSLGNVTHFLGFGYCAGYGEEYYPPKSLYQGVIKEICYPSGAAVLFKAEVLKKIGLFDQAMWMYNEDQDLGWRVWLKGYKCVLAPEAVVYHKYEFSRSIRKYYYLDRNRIIAILKNYHWATLILIFPAFLIMEIGLIFFSIKGGWFKEKMRVYKYFFSLKNWRYLRQARKQSQSLRTVPDKDIIKLFSGKIWYQEIGETRLRIANVIFNAYWLLAKVLIRW